MFNHIGVGGLICALLVACARPSEVAFDEPVGDVVRACEPRRRRRSSSAATSWSATARATSRRTVTTATSRRRSAPSWAATPQAVSRSPERPPRLLFYFNGGLNSQALVEQQARRQVPCMIADGYYPVFFVWDTDGLASYWEQVSSVWDGQVDRSFATRARTPLMVLGNVVSGLGQAPADYFIHGRRFFRALRREPRLLADRARGPRRPDGPRGLCRRAARHLRR